MTEFNHSGLTAFIIRLGVTVEYFESYPCSCVKDGHPDASCDCDGGFRYKDAVEGIMLRTAVNTKKYPDLYGMVEKGMAGFTIGRFLDIELTTINPVHKSIKTNDVIVVPGRSRRTSDILTKGTRDTLVAEKVSAVAAIYYNDVLVDPTKYTFSATTRKITWGTGEGVPADGEDYIVIFDEKYNYRIFQDVPQDRGSGGDVLPKRVYAVPRVYVQKTNTTMPDYIETR